MAQEMTCNLPQPAAATSDKLRLAQLIGSRICHDIISPIGAISNGMELIALSGKAGDEEFALISDSVAGAKARIRFYRIALGLASAEQKIGAPELRGILEDMYKGTRLEVDWALDAPARRDEVQAALLALLCSAMAMPSGGIIRLDRDGEAWSILAQAEVLRTSSELWAHLSDGGALDTLQPSEVQFALLPACTHKLGRALEVSQSDTEVSIRF